MRLLLRLLLLLALSAPLLSAAPLRVYLRSGEKTHGPGQHDHPRFLAEWSQLLAERGATVKGGEQWPATPQEWDATDVVLVHAQHPWDVTPEQKAEVERFTARGGGFVVLHAGVSSQKEPDWVRSVIGGAWRYGKAKYFEGELDRYYVAPGNPITAGASNYTIKDEMYYELDLAPEVRVLAASWTPDERAQKNGRAFPHIYEAAPQMWTYERGSSRAFVDLIGHQYANFALPHVRAIILRGLAWAGKRPQLDEFCRPEELASLRYPEGGPTAPEKASSQLELAPGFTAQLVAAEPLINKPIALDWDADGHLWVAETVEYPNGRRGIKQDFEGPTWKDHGGLVNEKGQQQRPALDRISKLVDTDGDGRADKKEVFYEGLELVTGFVFHQLGVIACAAPDIWLLEDADGDGKAEKAEKLYTGLGTRDTHAVINNLRWGLDGWIYATHGYSSSDDVTSPDRTKKFGKIGSGLLRFRPDGSAIEQVSSKGGNTWGLTVSAENELLWTQPTSGDLLMQTILPEKVLAQVPNPEAKSFEVVKKSPKAFPLLLWEQQAYRQIDYVGSFTAAAGCALYDGGAWPIPWNGNFFTTEPTINVVHHEVLTPKGVTYSAQKDPAREELEFIRSRDLWFRPIEVRTGPDGALYVADFYNQAVIHNDTRGPVHNGVNAAVRPDRDHYFGRVWRIQQADSKAAPVPKLQQATAAQLIEALGHPARAVRFAAQQRLQELKPTPEDVAALAKAAQPRASAHQRLHALWALHAWKSLSAETLRAALADGDALVARNALQLAALNPALAEPAPILSHLRGNDARLRLAALLALQAGPLSGEAAQALLEVVPKLDDAYSRTAALAVAAQAPVTVFAATPAMAGTEKSTVDFLEKLTALVRLRQPQTVPAVVQLLPGKLAVPVQLAILRGLSRPGGPAQVPAWSPEMAAAFQQLLAGSPEQATAAVPLVVEWDRAQTSRAAVLALVQKLLAQLQAPDLAAGPRGQVLSTLVAARSMAPEIDAALARELQNPDATVARALIVRLGETEDPITGKLLTEAFPQWPAALQTEALNQLVKRAEWTRAFVQALDGGRIALSAVGPLAQDKLRRHPNAEVAKEAAAVLEKLRGPLTAQKNEVIAKLLPEVETGGDSAKGAQTFQSACAVCHKFGNVGSTLAPDLSGMGTHPRAELLTHIVDPNREVDPSFVAFNFELKGGAAYQGVVVSENTSSVKVRDAGGEHDVAVSTIAKREELGRSLMPEGFEALGAETLRDLLAYLESADSQFRVVDLRPVATADSREGLFADRARKEDSMNLKKFGDVRVQGVPFIVLDPATTTTGRNLVVLQGGYGFAKTYPRKVELPVAKVPAKKLHILGGAGGWGYPYGGESTRGVVVSLITVEYADGTKQEIPLHNGIDLSDYIKPRDLPETDSARELVKDRQLRVLHKQLSGREVTKITLESAATTVAPVFVALTLER